MENFYKKKKIQRKFLFDFFLILSSIELAKGHQITLKKKKIPKEEIMEAGVDPGTLKNRKISCQGVKDSLKL
jgi:hypothetical protein